MGELLMVNPKKRKKTTKKSSTGKKITRRKRRSYKRNPIKMKGVIKDAVIPSATAAGGAIALDVIFGMLPLPANLKTGPMKSLVRGVGAIGLGMLANNIAGASTAKMLTTGALTVTMYDAMKNFISRTSPQIAAKAGWLPGIAPAGNVGEYVYIPESDEITLGYDGSGYQPDPYSEMDMGYYPDSTNDLGLYVEDDMLEDDIDI